MKLHKAYIIHHTKDPNPPAGWAKVYDNDVLVDWGNGSYWMEKLDTMVDFKRNYFLIILRLHVYRDQV